MIHRILYVLSFLILVPFTVISQIKTINISGQNTSWTVRYIPDDEIMPVIGSAYLNKDWMYGILTLNTNDSLSGLFRFNVLDQQMEMIYGQDTLLITNPSLVRNIRFNNKNFIYLPVIEKINGKEFIRFAYCEQVLPSQIQLFRNFEVDIRNNSYASNYMGGGGDGRDYYFHKTKLLYKERNKEVLRELPRDIKKLAIAFGIDYQTLKLAIKKNKLDISKENDIIRLITHTGISQIKTMNVSGQNISWTVRYIADDQIMPVIGSAYLNKDWMYGILTLNTNDSLSGLFRFNVLDQQMEMIYGQDTLLITNPSLVRNIRFNNKNFIYLPVIEKINGKEFIRFAYCEQVLPSQIQLFRNFEVDIRNNSYASNYMGGGGDGRDYYFHKTKLLYKGRNKEVLMELPGNIKKLAVAFGVNYPALKLVVKENKLNISKDNDIINLVHVLDKINYL